MPSCANKWLMNELARDTWGFDGYITSDCGAVAAVINDHHYTSTPEETVAVTLQAGMDIDCGSYVPDNLQAALSSGAVRVVCGLTCRAFPLTPRYPCASVVPGHDGRCGPGAVPPVHGPVPSGHVRPRRYAAVRVASLATVAYHGVRRGLLTRG